MLALWKRIARGELFPALDVRPSFASYFSSQGALGELNPNVGQCLAYGLVGETGAAKAHDLRRIQGSFAVDATGLAFGLEVHRGLAVAMPPI